MNPRIDDFQTDAAPIFFLTEELALLDTIKAARTWAGLRNRIRFFKSSDFAIAMLQGSAGVREIDGDLPLMVVIQRSSVGGYGLDLLNWLRSSPSFEEIPVIVLTDSTGEYELARCLELGANATWKAPEGMESWIAFFSNIRQAFESVETKLMALGA